MSQESKTEMQKQNVTSSSVALLWVDGSLPWNLGLDSTSGWWSGITPKESRWSLWKAVASTARFWMWSRGMRGQTGFCQAFNVCLSPCLTTVTFSIIAAAATLSPSRSWAAFSLLNLIQNHTWRGVWGSLVLAKPIWQNYCSFQNYYSLPFVNSAFIHTSFNHISLFK